MVFGDTLGREFTQIGNTTWKATNIRTHRESYIRLNDEKFAEDTPTHHFEQYQLLAPYLRMPRVRLLGDGALVVQRVKSEHILPIIDKQISHEDIEIGLLNFTNDLKRMWGKTVMPMTENSLSQNIRDMSINSLMSIVEDPEINSIGRLPLTINGEKYPSLFKTCAQALTELRRTKEKSMVLGHGDEHYKNIFIQSNQNYLIIDPKEVGYYSPAHAVNNLFGHPFIFYYQYKNQNCDINQQVNINYSLGDNEQSLMLAFDRVYQQLEPALSKMGPNLCKEYLFANILRGVIGRVHSKNKEHVTKNKFGLLAAAVQLYYSYPRLIVGQDAAPAPKNTSFIQHQLIAAGKS